MPTNRPVARPGEPELSSRGLLIVIDTARLSKSWQPKLARRLRVFHLAATTCVTSARWRLNPVRSRGTPQKYRSGLRLRALPEAAEPHPRESGAHPIATPK